MAHVIQIFLNIWLFCCMLYYALRYYPLTGYSTDDAWFSDVVDSQSLSSVLAVDDELSLADLPLCMKILGIIDLVKHTGIPALGGTIAWMYLQ